MGNNLGRSIGKVTGSMINMVLFLYLWNHAGASWTMFGTIWIVGLFLGVGVLIGVRLGQLQ